MPQSPLSNESSPYLQQHVDNPVQWYPWGEEALAKAKAENKIILLSIGYSACHWCHVMAKESFADPETAKIMNSLYINIKVDREERPDIDKIYQTAHFLLNQRPGGWPLTMFLTPDDQLPFFAGTYLPKEPGINQPDFKSLLFKINGYYQQNISNVKKQNHVMRQTLHKISHHSSSRELPSIQIVQNAINQLLTDHDAEHGGFGVAPKFSHTSSIELLLNYGQDRHHQASLQAAITTLSNMAKGGVYDQLEGGFFRYSVDQFWMIPHFEKMLYDNGLIVSTFAKAYKVTQDARFKHLIGQTCEWAIKRMQSPEGGFYSTLDADSDGSEGRYYAWEREEVKTLLSEAEYLAVATLFGIELDPNFEDKWHLHGYISLDKVAKMINMPIQQTEQLILQGKQKLLAARELRPTPARDDKILSSWNGLMIKGMAMSARMLDKNTYRQSAIRALDFIKNNCWSNQRLFAVHHQNSPRISGFIDDYAFMLDATIECLKLQWTNDNLRFAIELAEAMITHFGDKSHGGYFFTANDHEALIQRPKTLSDDATPAGNGVAAHALLTLGLLIGEQRYIEAAEGVIKSAQNLLNDAPTSSCTLVDTLDRIINLPYIIVVRCDEQELPNWQQTLATVRERHPVFYIPNHINLDEDIIHKPVMTESVAYVCKGQTCFTPMSNPAEVLAVDDIAVDIISL